MSESRVQRQEEQKRDKVEGAIKAWLEKKNAEKKKVGTKKESFTLNDPDSIATSNNKQ